MSTAPPPRPMPWRRGSQYTRSATISTSCTRDLQVVHLSFDKCGGTTRGADRDSRGHLPVLAQGGLRPVGHHGPVVLHPLQKDHCWRVHGWGGPLVWVGGSQGGGKRNVNYKKATRVLYLSEKMGKYQVFSSLLSYLLTFNLILSILEVVLLTFPS